MKNSVLNTKAIINCCVFTLAIVLKLSIAVANDLPLKSLPVTNTIFESIQAIANQDVVNLIIETDISSLMANKKKIMYQPALVRIVHENEEDTVCSISLSPRGRSRRKYCDFPPLKLKFSKAGLAELGLNTKYKSIKLVTHCNEGSKSSGNVIKEYLSYKLYQLLTDKSFNIQLAKIKYIDTETGKSYNQYGILIENVDEMAERIGGVEDERMGLAIANYDKAQLNLFATFQYMIGNEDWRLNFLRNVKLVRTKDGKITPVPYDFDSSGIVNAFYAIPDRDLKLQSVLQRQFMGQFDSEQERANTIDYIKSKKKVLLELVENLDYLSKRDKKEVINYLNSFFDIIEDAKKLDLAMPVDGSQPVASDEKGGN